MALLPASSQLIKISSKLCITVTVLVTVLITDRWEELPTNCKRFSKGCKLIIGWIPLIPLSRFFLSQRVLYVGQNRSFLEWGKGVIACCRIKCFNFHDQWKYEIKTPVNCFFFAFHNMWTLNLFTQFLVMHYYYFLTGVKHAQDPLSQPFS